jgi:hypothetical protein
VTEHQVDLLIYGFIGSGSVAIGIIAWAIAYRIMFGKDD